MTSLGGNFGKALASLSLWQLVRDSDERRRSDIDHGPVLPHKLTGGGEEDPVLEVVVVVVTCKNNKYSARPSQVSPWSRREMRLLRLLHSSRVFFLLPPLDI